MNTKQFLERVTQNWPKKVLCFVMALFIYFFHQMSILDTKTFTVPLSITANGSMISAMENNKYIKVSIRGQKEELASLTAKDITAYLDITNETKEGEYKFPVLIELSSRMEFMEPLEIKVKPEKIPLKIEKRSTRFIPLEPVFSGEPAYGFEKTNYTVVPANIKVEGPRKMIESLSSISTDAVDIEGVQQNITRMVLPVNENSLITLDTNTPVSVSVEIIKAMLTKDFTDLTVNYANLADTLEIENKPLLGSVTVEGSVIDLESLTSAEIVVQVNCGNITAPGTYNLPIIVILPSELKLLKMSDENVSIIVKEKEVPVPKTEGAAQ